MCAHMCMHTHVCFCVRVCLLLVWYVIVWCDVCVCVCVCVYVTSVCVGGGEGGSVREKVVSVYGVCMFVDPLLFCAFVLR